MKEIQQIINAYEIAKANEIACVLATVVHVDGSSYRRAGARMLVDMYGQMTGAISGGCLEGDALNKALFALQVAENKLVSYDTSDESDAVIGVQLGCNGIIQVLFEPIHFENPANPVELLKKAKSIATESIITTFFNLKRSEKQIGTSVVFGNNGLSLLGQITLPDLEKVIQKDVAEAYESKASQFRAYISADKIHNAFHAYNAITPKLILIGAGNDAQILASMADTLGWEIYIADGRHTHATSDRFMPSCSVKVSKPESVLDVVEISEHTYFVLMSHNYNYDLAVLRAIIQTDKNPYVGILGPKVKYDRMLGELNEQGIVPKPEQLAAIHAPVGLDIGAETSSEIALSILAEIQQFKTKSLGQPLKEKSGPIHAKKDNEFKTIVIS